MEILKEGVDWRALVAKKPGIHAWPPGQLSFFALAEEVLDYIAGSVNEKTTSLETGLGASTIVFAAQRSNHTCITPAADEIERLQAFFLENNVSAERLQFIPEYSEFALPRLSLPELDFVLIDGRHGFPAPMVDWYYTAKHLKAGGRCIVDDVHLWPVHLLVEYLSTSASWRVDRVFPRAVSYVRTRVGDESCEWIDQGNVQAKTEALQSSLQRQHQLRKVRELVGSGRIDLLITKTIRRLFRGS